MTASPDLDGPQWRFARDVYGRSGVSAACLTLQDEGGVDVTVLLVALFAATRRGLRVEAGEVAALDRAVAPWRARAVEPLRALRRDLKAGVEGAPADEVQRLRREIQRVEIECERLGLAMLAAVADGFRIPAGERPAEAALDAVVAFYRQDADGAARSLDSACREILWALAEA